MAFEVMSQKWKETQSGQLDSPPVPPPHLKSEPKSDRLVVCNKVISRALMVEWSGLAKITMKRKLRRAS